jgi:glycosyltransferase involved in cell wall biosynthesis
MPWLDAQLEALIAQRYTGDWEILVVDNGSTDASATAAAAWVARSDVVRWMDASEVKGPGAARNAGVAAADGDLLAFCDADDVVQQGWLAGLAASLADADVVAGFFDFWSLNGRTKATPQAASTSQLGFLPAGLGANLAVRRGAFEAVDGFNENLLIGEDVDLCWRLQLGEFRFALAPSAVVAKRDHPGFAENFRHGTAYGRSSPALYRRYRSQGARPDLRGAARSWLWLVTRAPLLLRRSTLRDQWAHAAGMRTGRIRGSVKERVFFP